MEPQDVRIAPVMKAVMRRMRLARLLSSLPGEERKSL